MEKIKDIKVIEILDSRGNPTLEVKIASNKFKATSSVPQGKSVGRYEAVSLPAWLAIKNIKQHIIPVLKQKEVDFQKIDKKLIELDGTSDKANLGANATLGISLVAARLQAKIEKKSLFKFLSQFFNRKTAEFLPNSLRLLMNIVNGGMHASSGPDIQEYMIVVKTNSAKESILLGAKIYHEMGNFFKNNIGDEGGYVPQEKDIVKPIDVISRIIGEKSVRHQVKIGLDVAASELFDGKKYHLQNYHFTSEELLEFYLKLGKKYDIGYLEDPFAEDNFDSFTGLKNKLKNTLIAGDDLTVTNPKKTREAIEKKSISGIIIKPNQIGTLSETIETINFAQKNGLKVIISHRSGETNDSFIADLAVACGAWGLKTGAPARGERVEKYNRLIEIEENF